MDSYDCLYPRELDGSGIRRHSILKNNISDIQKRRQSSSMEHNEEKNSGQRKLSINQHGDRKLSINQQGERKLSINQQGNCLYLKHTENSYRRLSILQAEGQNDDEPRRRSSLWKPGDQRMSIFSAISEKNDCDDFPVDSTSADIAEINSEIQRVEHFMDAKNKHLELDQLQDDLKTLKKSVEFDEELVRQQLKESRKSTVGGYMYKRRSVTKAAYL